MKKYLCDMSYDEIMDLLEKNAKFADYCYFNISSPAEWDLYDCFNSNIPKSVFKNWEYDLGGYRRARVQLYDPAEFHIYNFIEWYNGRAADNLYFPEEIAAEIDKFIHYSKILYKFDYDYSVNYKRKDYDKIYELCEEYAGKTEKAIAASVDSLIDSYFNNEFYAEELLNNDCYYDLIINDAGEICREIPARIEKIA